MVLRKTETIVANFMFFLLISVLFVLFLTQNYGKFMAVLIFVVFTNFFFTKTILSDFVSLFPRSNDVLSSTGHYKSVIPVPCTSMHSLTM